MDSNSRIFIAGEQHFVGFALKKTLKEKGFSQIEPSGDDCSFAYDPIALANFFDRFRPEYVFLVGGKSGGIAANQKYPATLMLDNLTLQNNVIDLSHSNGIHKLLFLGSSCSYPRLADQPIKESSLLEGPLEPTNECYALAKIAGMKLCEAFRREHGCNFSTAIPSNPFGPGEDFSDDNSHVIPALIKRMHLANKVNLRSIEIWGTGNPRRDFIFVDDLAEALVFVMNKNDCPSTVNISVGKDISIADLASVIRGIVGYQGTIEFDPKKPDGMPLKALDSEKIRSMGWEPLTPFSIAIEKTYEWFLRYHPQI